MPNPKSYTCLSTSGGTELQNLLQWGPNQELKSWKISKGSLRSLKRDSYSLYSSSPPRILWLSDTLSALFAVFYLSVAHLLSECPNIGCFFLQEIFLGSQGLVLILWVYLYLLFVTFCCAPVRNQCLPSLVHSPRVGTASQVSLASQWVTVLDFSNMLGQLIYLFSTEVYWVTEDYIGVSEMEKHQLFFNLISYK